MQVVGKITPQIRQLRKGLKETGVWPVLSRRKDVAEAVFPREVQICPQVWCIYFIVPMGKHVYGVLFTFMELSYIYLTKLYSYGT